MNTFDSTTEECINAYVKALHNDSAAVFLGAGMSRDCGYADWAGLMTPIAKALELKITQETDYTLLAQYYENKERNRGKLNNLLFDALYFPGATYSVRHEILSRLPISAYWTTNYDDLMENALRDEGRTVDLKLETNDFLRSVKGCNATMYKMHGGASKIHQVVITRRDYEEYNEKHTMFSAQFKYHYASKTFLYIGFSFADPNINFLLGQMKNICDNDMPTHYYLTKKEKNTYRYIRQKHQIEFLKNYGITTVLLKDYSMVKSILQEIENRYNQKSVLIAGNADGYGNWDARRAELFFYHLGYQLRKEGYTLISQMGNNVSKRVMQGANKYEQKKVTSYKPWMQKILPSPFEEESDALSVSYSGIGACIYLFGNREENGECVEVKEWEQELNAFRRVKIKVIPVASTGFAAQRMWKKITQSYSDYSYNSVTEQKNFEFLGVPFEPKELAEHSVTDYLEAPELLPDNALIQYIIRVLKTNP